VNTGSIKKRFILQKIKKLGVKIVCLNKEKNWAAPYVDFWIISDTTNHTESIQQTEKFMKENSNVKIDGAITFWEDDLLLNSKIFYKFNFIGIPYSVAKKARNKFLFRNFCQKNNIPYAKHRLLKDDDDIDHVIGNFSFPIVIKPVFGASSAYVTKIENQEELKDNINHIRKSLSLGVESALSDGFDIMAEEYIDGEEVDMDILIQNSRMKFCSISDNTRTREPFFVETDRFTPANLPIGNQEKLISMADEILEKMNIQNGCIHLEAKYTQNGPVPLEINLRMGGDEIYSSVKSAWKVDLIENALKINIGQYIKKINTQDNPRKYLAARTLYKDESGVIVKLEIDEKLEKKKYLEEFEFFKKIGDPIFVPPDGFDYPGWIMVSGDNLLDAQENLEEAVGFIDYEISPFRSASSIGKTMRKNKFSYSSVNKALVIGRAKIEKLRRTSVKDQRKLHIGIVCNLYEEKTDGMEVENELSSVGKNIEKTLMDRGYKISFFDFNHLGKVFSDLKKSDVDIVINVCERINNSSLLEPHAASILDVLQIPYTGSNPYTLSLCIDKIRVKKLLTYHKIPTPNWDYLYSLDDKIRNDLKYPLIVKPANTDNSIGITNESVVTNPKELNAQLKKVISEIGRPALIEEYIEGDEYDVSIIGSEEDDLRILPLSRSIFYKMPKGYWHIYPYEAKFLGDNTYKKNIIVERPPKKISKKLESLIGEIALDTYNILDCHDYGRVEIRVDKNNNPYVLELNPNPSINIPDCVPSVAKLVGYNYGDFLEEIIRMAINRYKNNPPYYHLQAKII
jgi:D-alanine-D-alanine ligase